MLALAGYLLGIGVLAGPLQPPLPALLFCAAAYLLLALGLVCGVRAALRIAWPLGLGAALACGALLVWHHRETLETPVTRAGFVACSALAGLVLFGALLPGARRAPLGRYAALGAACAALLGLLLGAGYQQSNTIRWYLLRHAKLFGTPLYYALATPVENVRSELWRERTHTEAPPPRAPLPPAAADGVRPNLVVLLVDTLRADALAAWGGDPALMPELDRLAKQAWRFDDVLGNATWTRPSVASLFTGLLPEQHGAIDREDRLPSERTTLAEVLVERGYTTAAFVANWGAVGRDSGFADGFAHFEQLAEAGSPYARAGRVNEAIEDWFAQRNADGGAGAAPVFLFAHFLDPHTPYLSGGPPPLRSALGRQAYDAELRYLDAELARLFAQLERNLPGPTWVLLSSDHGEEFWEHAEGGHGHALYPEVLRVPLLLWSPQREAGRSDAALETRDFFDLLLRLAGTPDLDPGAWAAQRARATRYASVYSTTTGMGPHRPYLRHVAMRAVERDGWQLIWSGYGDTVELYDLRSDPQARANLAARHPEKVAELQRELERATPAVWSRREPVEHSAETHDLLKILGYVE